MKLQKRLQQILIVVFHGILGYINIHRGGLEAGIHGKYANSAV
jgi:hypothetical protein